MGLLDFLRSGKTKDRKDPEISIKEPYIFISYALADTDEVFEIIQQFQDRGYHVWYDKGVVPDEKQAERIADALENASLFLVFLTPESQALVNIRKEIDCAINNDKPLLAVYLKETKLAADLQLKLASRQAILKYDLSDDEFFEQCSFAFERLGLFETPAIQPSVTEFSDLTESTSDLEENLNSVLEHDERFVPRYDKTDRNHMRRLLQKGSLIIDLIAEDQVPFGTHQSAEMIDLVANSIGHEIEKQKDDDELQELKDDRYSLINLYGAIKKLPAFVPLYVQLGNLLHKYGLFDEEVVLLEKAISDSNLNNTDLIKIKNRLNVAMEYRDADDASMDDTERITENLRRALQKKPLDVSQIREMLEQCTDDVVLYDVACNTDKDPDMVTIREKAARLIKNRDYQYALSSYIFNPARTDMILNLNDSLEGDELFVARVILTDPNDENKSHMLIYCKDESLLMLGWLYVHGIRKFCADKLHYIGSRFPEAYEEMTSDEKNKCRQDWLMHASELVIENILPEDKAVSERLSGSAAVYSEPLHFFLSIQHPRKPVRWWHANKLKNPVYIAYVGSWTADDQIKEALSVKIDSTELITEMV
ncbi:MAG: toll/interleukin-1 receptor domain-containing protein, partial [Erysipelotrichaceae bacterium]|nr:toll/interleukin-1 receptor domain-containing protein [Erysipelotrichaceae bacterium]